MDGWTRMTVSLFLHHLFWYVCGLDQGLDFFTCNHFWNGVFID